jgi:hypothetical protein
LAIFGYTLAIRKNSESRFYQGFQALCGKSHFSEAKVLAIEVSIKESIQKLIQQSGLWVCYFAAAAPFFKYLGQGSACFFLLTTHSQRVRAGGQQGRPPNPIIQKMGQRLFSFKVGSGFDFWGRGPPEIKAKVSD